jgi:hypothetical protein
MGAQLTTKSVRWADDLVHEPEKKFIFEKGKKPKGKLNAH